jgi:arsenate reductase
MGTDLKKPELMVLFVCVENAGRSRMAEAFFNELAGDGMHALSAGTEPAPAPHPEVVSSMLEAGIPLEDRPGQLLTQELVDSVTRVIGMGCNVKEACPAISVPLEDWDLENPKGQPPQVVDRIRDEIRSRVVALIEELVAQEQVAGGRLEAAPDLIPDAES